MQITNPSPNPSILRWKALLQGALAAGATDPPADAQAGLTAARGQHRGWIVACLRAIEAHRRGVPIALDSPLRAIHLPAPAANGQEAANIVWEAYLQFCLGSPAAGTFLAEAVRSLDPTALRAGIDDNPEPWWANELLILHALQSFTFLAGDAALQGQIDRCVAFHVAEIQPDHATNEPWAIHAFAAYPDGAMTAETLLHAATIQGCGTLTPVARLIVFDALHALGD